MMNNRGTYYTYDTSKYKFNELLSKMMDWDKDNLSNIHTKMKDSENWNIFKQIEAVKTPFHKMYYESPYYNTWKELYYKFIKEEIFPLFPIEIEEFVVQKDPSVRFCLPNNTSIGIRNGEDFNSEMIGCHCDTEFGHPPGELNFILSFTDMFNENSVYYESEPNKGDFTPIKMSYGSFFHFWGNKCRHYNKINKTGKSRLSYDFRIMPLSSYDEYFSKPSYHGRKFIIGDYYIKMSR
jgi:hypothetical protein